MVGSARFGGAFQIDGLGKISAKMRFGKLKKKYNKCIHVYTDCVFLYQRNDNMKCMLMIFVLMLFGSRSGFGVFI